MAKTSLAGPVSRSQFAGKKLSFWGIIQSESLKFRSLATNWIMTAVIAVVMIGMAPLYATILNSMAQDAEKLAKVSEQMAQTNAGIENITNLAYAMGSSGIDLANMLVASLATVFIGSEYSTRSIQSNLTAVPRRSSYYLAKIIVLSVYSFVLGVAVTCIGYWAGYAVLNSTVKDTLEFNNGLVLNWVAAGIYFVFMAWMGYGFGTLFRNNAAGIVMVVVVFFILPVIAAIFSGQVQWVADAMDYLPSSLGRVILTYDLRADADISYVEGGAWLALWAFTPALLGYLRFCFTDTRG